MLFSVAFVKGGPGSGLENSTISKVIHHFKRKKPYFISWTWNLFRLVLAPRNKKADDATVKILNFL